MARRDVIVIGASAGGIEALTALVSKLPAELPAAVLVVVHIPSGVESALPAILERATRLRVAAAPAGPLENGTLYVAPPDHHLTLRGRAARLERGPRFNGHRPAVDPLFQSAARAVGARAIGVILSGALDDGAAGMVDISNAGGLTLVQSPDDAFHSGMPRSVMERIDVDFVLPAAALGTKLVELAGTEVKAPASSAPRDPEDAPSSFSCPECHGVLWWNRDEARERYRCRVGHVYAPKTLFAAQSHALEEAIWTAYRALEESADLARRLAARARAQNLPLIAERYEQKHADACERAELVRAVIDRGELDAVDPSEVRREAGGGA